MKNIITSFLATFALAGALFTSGCSSLPSSNSTGAIATNASTLVSDLQQNSGTIETAVGAGPKTSADIEAGLWAAKVLLTAMQGQSVTLADINTGVPQVNNVLQKYLTGHPVAQSDVNTISSAIDKLTSP